MLEGEVEQEIENVLGNFDFGITTVRLVSTETEKSVTTAAPYATFELTLLEGPQFKVQFSDSGFSIMGSDGEVYESFQQLLSEKSPMYRQRFHQKVLEKLSQAQSQ